MFSSQCHPTFCETLWDAPLDSKGKLSKPKKMPVMAWIGAPTTDGKTRLIAPNAQQA
jgi:hypothetical protein